LEATRKYTSADEEKIVPKDISTLHWGLSSALGAMLNVGGGLNLLKFKFLDMLGLIPAFDVVIIRIEMKASEKRCRISNTESFKLQILSKIRVFNCLRYLFISNSV
jgi:hypothetical protein